MVSMPTRGGLGGSSPLGSIEDLVPARQRDFGAGSLIICDRLVRIYIAAGIEVQALQGLDLLVNAATSLSAPCRHHSLLIRNARANLQPRSPKLSASSKAGSNACTRPVR